MADDLLDLADSIIREIVERYDNARRDEGAFPPGDRRAAMSEHRLWLAMQTARYWRNSRTSPTGNRFGSEPIDRRPGELTSD